MMRSVEIALTRDSKTTCNQVWAPGIPITGWVGGVKIQVRAVHVVFV